MSDDRPIEDPRLDPSSATPSSLEFGGKFEVLEQIGRGGMGAVYRVRHRKLNHVRAVKVLPAGSTAESVERLRREAAIATELSHPSIVTVYDLEELPDGGLAIVMEFLQGDDLGRHLRKQGPLSLEAVVRSFTGVVDAMDRMHDAGVIHRDIKPGNFFVCTDGALKVLDFGISRAVDDDSALTRTGQSLGTPAFMAPEQLEGHPLTRQADIYALGAVLYLALTGRHPYTGSTQAELIANVLLNDPPRADEVRPDLPGAVADALQRALAKEPGERFERAGDLLRALGGRTATAGADGTLTMEPGSGPPASEEDSLAATSAPTAEAPLPLLAPGTDVDRYQVETVLGRGGMAVVYRVRHRHLDSRHALKVLHVPARSIEARLMQEGRVQSALKDPNVVAVTDVVTVDGSPGLIMEYVDGPALSSLLKQGSLTLPQALRLAGPVLSGVAAAHRHGLIHRDLKPANVLLDTSTGELTPKITDFGLAKLLDVEGARSPLQTRSGTPMGTPAYMAPEQIRDASTVDERADVFACGAILYELLSGERAFQGRDTMEVFTAVTLGRVEPLQQRCPDLPDAVAEVVHRALATEPAERYPDGGALLEAWRAATDEPGRSTDPATISDAHLLQRVRGLGRGPAPSPLPLQTPRRSTGRGTEVMSGSPRPSPTPEGFSAPTEVDTRPLGTPPPAPRRRGRGRTLAAVVVALVLLACVTYAVLHWSGRRPPAFPVTGEPVLTQFTFAPGHQFQPALSPDGRQLVYSDGQDLYLRRVGGERSLNLTEEFEPASSQPAWSPSGEQIAFSAGGAVHVMGALGERPRQVAERGHWPTWSPDEKQLAYVTVSFSPPFVVSRFDGELWTVDLDSGEQATVETAHNPLMSHWSPDGQRIAFMGTVDGWYRLFTVRPDGSDLREVSEREAWAPRFTSDGQHLCFLASRGDATVVECLGLDPETGEADDDVRTLLTVPGDRSWHLSLSGDDQRWAMAAVEDTAHVHSVALDPATGRATGPLRQVTTGAQQYGCPAVSPDGQRIAFTSAGQHENLYTARVDGSDVRTLSTGEVYTRGPAWSPDGQRIAFYGERNGVDGLWSVRPDGGDLRRLSGDAATDPTVPLWSPDGRRMAFTDGTPRPYCVDLDGDWDAQVAAQRAATEQDAAIKDLWATDWSPDGRWLAATRAWQGQLALVDTETCTVHKTFDRGYYAVWMSDSRRLLVGDDARVDLLDTTTGASHEVISLAPGSLPETPMLDVSPDDRTLFVAVDTADADVWIADFVTPE